MDDTQIFHERCGVCLVVVQNGAGYCSEKCRRIGAMGILECPECNGSFRPTTKNQIYCCPPCREKAAGQSRKRGAVNGKGDQRVTAEKVFSRDSYTCQICGITTPPGLRGCREPNAPEIDHVIPLSKGGTNTMSNVQCACRRCNALKSDRTDYPVTFVKEAQL